MFIKKEFIKFASSFSSVMKQPSSLCKILFKFKSLLLKYGFIVFKNSFVFRLIFYIWTFEIIFFSFSKKIYTKVPLLFIASPVFNRPRFIIKLFFNLLFSLFSQEYGQLYFENVCIGIRFYFSNFYLQIFTKYLTQTLVFMCNSALQEKFNFCFSGVFRWYWQNFHFGRRTKQ